MTPQPLPLTFFTWLAERGGVDAWLDARGVKDTARLARITRAFVAQHPGRRRFQVLTGLAALV